MLEIFVFSLFIFRPGNFFFEDTVVSLSPSRSFQAVLGLLANYPSYTRWALCSKNMFFSLRLEMPEITRAGAARTIATQSGTVGLESSCFDRTKRLSWSLHDPTVKLPHPGDLESTDGQESAKLPNTPKHPQVTRRSPLSRKTAQRQRPKIKCALEMRKITCARDAQKVYARVRTHALINIVSTSWYAYQYTSHTHACTHQQVKRREACKGQTMLNRTSSVAKPDRSEPLATPAGPSRLTPKEAIHHVVGYDCTER